MSMEAIGRIFNVVPQASGVHIPLNNAAAVTFVGYEDGGATDVVFTESVQGASKQSLATVTRYFTSNGIGGVWTTQTVSATATVEPTDDTAQDGWAVTIRAAELSAGFDAVECTPDAGTCFAIVHDLNDQRDPDSLPAAGVAEVA